MAKAKKEKQELAPWMYDVIRAPVVTEKSTMGSQFGHFTFMVSKCSTKPQIKAAVEALFDVKVEGVNTLTNKGKTKFFKGRKGFRSDEKKAVVRLAEDQTIDIGVGL